MGLNHVVTFAQASFGRDAPPPDGRWHTPPSWISIEAVAALRNGTLAPEEPADNQASTVPEVQILDPRDTIGVDDETPDDRHDPSQSDSLQSHSHGTDALAYYLPFHFYRTAWGIYVRESGLKLLTRVLKGVDTSSPDSVWVRLAYEVLYQHEMFHHLCELVASLGEVAWLAETYQPYFSDKTAAESEEAMANAYVFRTGVNRRLRDARPRLKDWMNTQGAGYRDFARHTSSQAFQRGQHDISQRMFLATSDGPSWQRFVESKLGVDGRGISDWPGQTLFDAVASQKPRIILRDRTYLVMDCSPPWLSVFKPFPGFNGVRVEVHTREHKPPHFHVFIPPDRRTYLTRYTWPELHPYNGDYQLSRRERHRLDEYLEKYGADIEKKIQRVPW